MQLEIKIEIFQGMFEVAKTENGSQWTIIYKDVDLDKTEIIVDAYKKVGYKDVTRLD